MSAPAPRRALRRGRSRAWLVAVAGGVVCLLLGLGALGFSAYDLFWRPVVDPRVASAERAELRQRWAAGAGKASGAPAGEAVALLRIPRLGAGFEHLVLAGTAPAALRRGLGWYDGTAAPGEVGNFAVAGHRGSTGPLAGIADLRAGDQVVVETSASVFTYALTNNPAELTVTDTDTWVIQPVPGRPELRPTEALITLTTAQALFRSDGRTVAFGTLVATAKK